MTPLWEYGSLIRNLGDFVLNVCLAWSVVVYVSWRIRPRKPTDNPYRNEED